MDISLKRALAYIIDMLIVLFAVSLLRTYTNIDPYKDSYEENLAKYNELATKNAKEDGKYNDELIELNQELNKNLVLSNVMTITGLLLYFGLFEWISKGKTIGKRLMNLKTSNIDQQKRLSIWQCLLRILIVGNMLFSIVAMICAYAITGKPYIYTLYILQLIEYGIYMTNILMMIFRKDHRGIHDILSKTFVMEENLAIINSDEVGEETNQNGTIKQKVSKIEKKKNKIKE